MVGGMSQPAALRRDMYFVFGWKPHGLTRSRQLLVELRVRGQPTRSRFVFLHKARRPLVGAFRLTLCRLFWGVMLGRQCAQVFLLAIPEMVRHEATTPTMKTFLGSGNKQNGRRK